MMKREPKAQSAIRNPKAMSTSTEFLPFQSRTAAARLGRCQQAEGDSEAVEALAALAAALREQLAEAPSGALVYKTVARMLIGFRAWSEDVDAVAEDARRIRADWAQVGEDLRCATDQVRAELQLEGVVG